MEQFQLQYGYIHCVGKTAYPAGTVDSEAEAIRWVNKHRGQKLPVPDSDPVCWCPVRHCHIKRQRPWVGYEKIVSGSEFRVQS